MPLKLRLRLDLDYGKGHSNKTCRPLLSLNCNYYMDCGDGFQVFIQRVVMYWLISKFRYFLQSIDAG